MKIDITSLCFGFKIEKKNDSGTAAWATSIGQAPKGLCYIDTNREGLDEIVYGMMYKSHSDFGNLKDRDVEGLDKKEEPRGDRERMMFSVFEDVYVNNKKVDGIYTLTYEREDSLSHKNRLHICYAKYLTYNGHSNKETLAEMAKVLGCNTDACWFVSAISIKYQKELHFSAIVVNPTKSMTYSDSKTRKKEWEALIPNENNIPKEKEKHQQIFYGAPGTGKSHKIKYNAIVKNADERQLVFRTTFHPDSDYSTFVGAYKPTMKPVADKYKAVAGKDEEIIYSFVPQAFLQAYIAAWNNPEESVFLIIEEINRGNCAQIFGDLFQLLDRDKEGFSEYPIMADNDLKNYLNGKDEFGQDVLTNKDGIKENKLNLPKNLYIWATMNTSDQSLFPIDSAFKRRWEWKYIKIKKGKDENGNDLDWKIDVKMDENGALLSWWNFIEKINTIIASMTSSADKQLGFFFCLANADGIITTETFVSKVIFYLWNDVFKDYGFEDASLFRYTDKDGKEYDLTFPDFYDEDGEKVNTERLTDFLKKVMSWKKNNEESN